MVTSKFIKPYTYGDTREKFNELDPLKERLFKMFATKFQKLFINDTVVNKKNSLLSLWIYEAHHESLQQLFFYCKNNLKKYLNLFCLLWFPRSLFF